MAQPFQRRLWCAFSDDIDNVFPIDCILNVDYVADVKEKIWTKNQPELAQVVHRKLELYSPVSPVKDNCYEGDSCASRPLSPDLKDSIFFFSHGDNTLMILMARILG